MNDFFKNIYDNPYPVLTEQLNPFGNNSDIDFIEQDEASYYAMDDAMKEDKK